MFKSSFLKAIHVPEFKLANDFNKMKALRIDGNSSYKFLTLFK